MDSIYVVRYKTPRDEWLDVIYFDNENDATEYAKIMMSRYSHETYGVFEERLYSSVSEIFGVSS